MMIHLLRMRLGFFKNQTKGLYDRYIDVCVLLAFLCAPALLQAPTLIAYPLLVFFEHPVDVARNLAPLLAWLGLGVVWARIHRNFILGGQLAQFMRSLPISTLALRLADIVMLIVGMAVLVVPVGVAAWTALHATSSTGADGRFWYYLLLTTLLTLSLAQDVVYGSARRIRLLQVASLFALLSPAAAAPLLRHELLLCALSAALITGMCRTHHAVRQAGYAPADWLEKLAWCPPLVFVLTNFRRFLNTQWHDSVSRMLWAILPLAFSWWMIVSVGKHNDAPMFVHFALGCFTGILAGSYRPLLDGRAGLTAYARSIDYGELLLALADHALMLTLASVLLVPWLCLFAARTDLFSGVYLAKLFVFYVALLLVLGQPWVQMHKRTVIVKFAIATIGMLIAGTLL